MSDVNAEKPTASIESERMQSENADAKSEGAQKVGSEGEVKKQSLPDRQRLKLNAIYHGKRILAYLAAFAAMDAWVVSTALPLAYVLSAVTALVVGHYLAEKFHEWGHFVGARVANSHSPMVPKPNEEFVFGFNMEKNNASQFLSMSVGGAAGNFLLVLLVLSLLPLDNLARAALFAMVLGKAIGVVIFEGPVIYKVLKGGDQKQELDLQLENGSLNRGQLYGYIATALIWLAIY